MRFFNLFTLARTEIVNKKSAKTTYYSRSVENGADKVKAATRLAPVLFPKS